MNNKLLKLTAISTLLASSIFSVALAGQVATEGSTSTEKTIGILGELFTNQNPDIKFTYNPTGSSAGISAAIEGRTDIGLSSRDLSDKESAKVISQVLALDGIVVVVNNSNPVANLTLEQLKDVYTGKISNWKDLGGADAPISLIGREAGSGTRDGFETITQTKDQCKYRQELSSTGDVITSVSTNPNAVGYASLSAVSDKIKVVSINGVNPTSDTVKDGSYKLQRSFLMVYPKDKQVSADVQKFLDFTKSKEAQKMIEKSGAIAIY